MPAPRFWQTATLHLDPACPLRAITGGYLRNAGGERHGEIGMTLPADAPALARPTCRLGFFSRHRWCRRAAPPSHPTPCEKLLEIVVGVSDLRPCSSPSTAGSLELRPQEQPAAAGMQARTPTCLLHPSITLRIAPLPCPTGGNSPMLRRPQSPRVFPAPVCHSDSCSTLRHPLPLRRNVMQRVTLALVEVRRHP